MAQPSNTATANTILTNVAAEMGIDISPDPYSGVLEGDRQLRAHLSSAGRNLLSSWNWETLRRIETIDVLATDDGVYPLPSDFKRILNQTGWNLSSQLPLAGPLTPQEWSTLVSRTAVSTTILGFRIAQDKFLIYPFEPVGSNASIRYEYISNNWVLAADMTTYRPDVTTGDDVVLYDQTMFEALVKYRYLQSKGFDASAAWSDFEDMFNDITGQEKGAPIITTNNTGDSFPYLDAFTNTSDTGFGF